MAYYFFYPLLIAALVHAAFVLLMWLSALPFRVTQFQRSAARDLAEDLRYSLPFLVLSFVIGFLSGVSQQPTLSALVPAIITFFGGAIAFIYVNDHKKLSLIGVLMISFSVTLVYSMKCGATLREITRDNNVFSVIDLEKRIANRRAAVGLPPMDLKWLYEGKHE